MGVDFAGNYACLCIGYLEKVKLFGLHTAPRFTEDDIQLLLEAFLRYVDDGFIFWPKHLNINTFIEILGQLHPKIVYTVERGEVEGNKQSINFLDIHVTLHDNKRIETELYYKPTNTHHYIEYNSFHAKHVLDNIPYNFFKKISVFTSDSTKEKQETRRMRCWLQQSGYPQRVIDKGLHDARLQGPAPDPNSKKDIVPFVTLNCANYTTKSVVKTATSLFEKCPDKPTRDFFAGKMIVQALRQPPNILRQLTSAKFNTEDTTPKRHGIFGCKRVRCKVCRPGIGCLVECTEFQVANGTMWTVPSHLTCNSKMVIYYVVCLGCKAFSKVGKTNNFLKRTYQHVSEGLSGNTDDVFDKHVYACNVDRTLPIFNIYMLMEVNHYDKLLVYENYFHGQAFDTLNKDKANAT